MPPTNTAAFQTSGTPGSIEVKPTPFTSPREDEIVVKNGAVAINPLDWIKPEMGNMIYSWIKYPFIFGEDVAGEVVEIGSAVTRFKVGDRVVGNAVSLAKERNNSAEGGFQTYTVLLSHMASPIPDAVSYESAAVLPLGLSTAACGLFQKDQLALQYPSVSPTSTGKTLLVWGGSTSVGCNAIQLAVAAGYEVVATCSPRNFDLVKKLGASRAFDYNSKTAVADIINECKGRTMAGAFAIGPRSADACLDVLDKCQGDKFIAMATYPAPQQPSKYFAVPKMIVTYVSWSTAFWVKSKARGIRSNFIFGDTLIGNGVGKAIYVDFLPEALAKGTIVPAPEPLVIGKGLEFVKKGLEMQKKGVSAKKVVVSL